MNEHRTPDAAALRPTSGGRLLLARTAGICGAAIAAQLPAILLIGWPMEPIDFARILGNFVVDYGCVALLVAMTLQAVESSRLAPLWRHGLLAAGLAAAVATQLKPGTAHLFNDAGFAERVQATGLNTDLRGLRLTQLWFSAILACLSAVYLMQRNVSIEAEQRLKQLEAQWMHARRQVRLMRDAAGAARLDPQVLFDCLGLARREYLRDPAGADALLDRLIDFLRGTLAGTRSGAHTLGLEVGLAVRFAALVSSASGTAVTDGVPPALRQLDVSPGLLLPLVQQWLAHCFPAADAQAQQPLRIDAAIEGADGELLCLRLCGPAVESEVLLAEARARLAELFGGQARLRATVTDAAAPLLEVRIELPLMSAHV